jgi:branched-chain amino acid aminotransferase
VLEGITRRTVIELAPELGLDVHVGSLSVADLRRAEEIFLTSTAGGVIPVSTLDGMPVGVGRPGPITTQIRNRYWELHRDPRYTEAIEYEAPAAAMP